MARNFPPAARSRRRATGAAMDEATYNH